MLSRPSVRSVPATSAWFSPSSRVPRQDQVVRVLTVRGVDHEAQFAVAHTDDWPSGAAWALTNGRASLPFSDVALWSPDPTATPPRATDDDDAGAEAAPEGPPAILAEVVAEVERTGTILRLLPGTHLEWSPHPDIPDLKTLSLRLVRIVARIAWILDLDEVELAFEPDLPDFTSVNDIVETYAANEADVRRLAATTDAAALRAPWALERNAASLARLSRGAALRGFGLTPIVYHRAEIALMLTALGVRVPHPYPLWAFDDPAAPPG